jgi:DNA-binding Xre family transcriptional regulator
MINKEEIANLLNIPIDTVLDDKAIGKQIMTTMLKQGLDNNRLAAQISMKPNTITRIISGTYQPNSYRILVRIASILAVPLEDLVTNRKDFSYDSTESYDLYKISKREQVLVELYRRLTTANKNDVLNTMMEMITSNED